MSAPAVSFYDLHPAPVSLKDEVLAGLARDPKSIPPKFFYDQRGSKLFDTICDLPEYYLTRTEVSILRTHAEAIAQLIGPDCLLIEFGSGSSQKIRLLLDTLLPKAYMPMDISRDHLLASAEKLAADYSWLEVHATCIDYSQAWHLPYCPEHLKRIAFFPGSSIGNFPPDEAFIFMRRVAGMIGSDGGFLIGVDLKKDTAVLSAAYNDSQNITAGFNLNLLTHINHELDANFNLSAFKHVAFYNADEGRIEMHLESMVNQTIIVAGQSFEFVQAERMHTENSYKYGIEEFQALAEQAGFVPRMVWTDSENLFSVHYLLAKLP